MRKTVRDWKNDWIESNGITSELEVVIDDSDLGDSYVYVYEGCFAKIPTKFLDRNVIGCGRMIDSSIPERRGAYLLII